MYTYLSIKVYKKNIIFLNKKNLLNIIILCF